MSQSGDGAEARIRNTKLEKISALRAEGVSPYPERFARTHRLHEAARLPAGTPAVRIAGRVVSRREFGKLAFFDLQDLQGRCQVSAEAERIGKDAFKVFSKMVDIGDFLGVEGETGTTKVGLPVVKMAKYEILGKTLPLPEKFHSLNDQELCYRKRYLELIMDAGSRERFQLRTRVQRALRALLDENGFEEVETPVLQVKASGALAKPFVTHHNALDMELYLRIAPETYLKRCIVGGYDRVYEFARVFRNEGIDPSHLQDFTMLEFYAAYWNYVDNMNFTEQLLRGVVERATGGMSVTCGSEVIDFGSPWPRHSLTELIARHCGIDVRAHPEPPALRAVMAEKGIETTGLEKLGWGALVDQLYKKVARPHIVQPTFVTSHPIELSPLARRNDSSSQVADRFQLVVRGWEIVNAYSELVDPIDQRARLEEQARLHAAGDEEAMIMEEDYLQAMEYGMPPISGWGLGIDRLVALLAGAENLRDVILFPLMKPESEPDAGGSRAP